MSTLIIDRRNGSPPTMGQFFAELSREAVIEGMLLGGPGNGRPSAPGKFILRQPPEVRARLAELTAADIQSPPWWVLDQRAATAVTRPRNDVLRVPVS